MSINLYPLFRKILFRLDAEAAHNLAMKGLRWMHQLKLIRIISKPSITAPVNVMGIRFANPVGLAAGLDKNGDYFEALAQCGFGFIEIGTVTPRPQPGNLQPRMFRLPEAEAIINRMGFNNHGVDYLVSRVRRAKYQGVLGINIGKNFDTPVEKAVDDYLICLNKVYAYADYVTVNISSPNTPGLRDLQFGEALTELIVALKNEQKNLSQQHDKYVPIAIKIAPDMDDEQIKQLSETFLEHKIDAVIATNTTSSRQGVENMSHASEQGGLSGKPVRDKADHVLQVMANYLHGDIPIIAVGGISSAQDAQRKIQLGASLVQIYTGFIYQGPTLIHQCAQALVK